jgi:hypothetical protein
LRRLALAACILILASSFAKADDGSGQAAGATPTAAPPSSDQLQEKVRAEFR